MPTTKIQIVSTKFLNRAFKGMCVATLVMSAACGGTPGEAGKDGTNGIDGSNGTNGVDGNNGSDGTDGSNGTDGFDGVNGNTGSDGGDGIDGIDGIDGVDAVLDPALPTFEKALVGLGGTDVVSGIETLSIAATGTRSIALEGLGPNDSKENIDVFDVTTSIDVQRDATRVTWDRTLSFFGFPVEQEFSEIVDGNLGFIDGSESIFGLPGGNMSSARLASLQKQVRLMNPQLLLQAAIEDPTIASEAGFAIVDGNLHERLVIEDVAAPITLFVNAATGRISKLRTLENDPLASDVVVEVFFSGWQQADEGELNFPRQVVIAVEDTIVHRETRTMTRENPTLAATVFDLPAQATPVFDAAAALEGERNGQYVQAFASIGIPLDGLGPNVTSTELSPGVFRLSGFLYNSLAIEQDAGVVIVEAPLSPERGEAILAWAATEFPGKPVTHLVVSHFHRDHSAGVRAFVAAGVTIVSNEESIGFLGDIFSRARTVQPDSLAQLPVTPSFLALPTAGSITLADATNPVSVHAFENGHVEAMAMTEVANHVYIVDLYSPGFGVSPESLEFHEALIGLGLTAPTIVGGHGGVVSLADFETELVAAGLL